MVVLRFYAMEQVWTAEDFHTAPAALQEAETAGPVPAPRNLPRCELFAEGQSMKWADGRAWFIFGEENNTAAEILWSYSLTALHNGQPLHSSWSISSTQSICTIRGPRLIRNVTKAIFQPLCGRHTSWCWVPFQLSDSQPLCGRHTSWCWVPFQLSDSPHLSLSFAFEVKVSH
jgi:hypothetical protein